MLQKMLHDNLNMAGISLKDESLDNIRRFFGILCSARNRTNLIGKICEEEIINFLFFDSLLGLLALDLKPGAELIDIGCGAGFPGIMLAIALPEVKVTLLDSCGKKIDFVKAAAKALNLKNLFFINDRAEIAAHAKQYRENFDFVISKAVAELSELIELCSPFIKVKGKFAAWKGIRLNEEIHNMGNGNKIMKLGEPEVFNFDFSDDLPKTGIIVFEKTAPVPERYPRSYQAMKRKPISKLHYESMGI